jgi:hypothetical protein
MGHFGAEGIAVSNMRRAAFIPLIVISASLLAISEISFCQSFQDDPFAKRVASIRLEDESLIVSITRLGHDTGLAVSIEYPLAESVKDRPPVLHRYHTEIQGGTVSEVLDRLTALDQQFSWTRSGKLINVFPRSVVADRTYLMNRIVNSLSYDRVSDVEQAVYSAVGQLPLPREQIAVLQSGTLLTLPEPWTATFQNITVRELLDQIMMRLGPQYGWELSGSKDFRLLRFHSAY